jgi:hypothetical protein
VSAKDAVYNIVFRGKFPLAACITASPYYYRLVFQKIIDLAVTACDVSALPKRLLAPGKL